MKTQLFFRFVRLTVLSLTFFLPHHFSIAQERVTVPSSGAMSWDEMVRIEASRAHIPETQRSIHQPLPGPGPREIGAPTGRSSQSTSPQHEHSHAAASSDATAMSVSPTLDFEAIPDNNTSIPPDTHGSVGPSHVMTMLNTEVRIQSKTGTILSTVSLATFWTSIAGSKFDPKVHYDAGSSRWLAVCDANAALATSKVCFAISGSSDPTGSWTFYEFDADAADTLWADYPGFGFNSTWIAITHNMFNFAGVGRGAKMWVIDKSTAVAGGALTTTVLPTGFDLSGAVSGFTLQPCVTFGAEPTLYIVDNSGYSSGGTFLVRISRITGTGPSPVWSVQPGSTFASTGLFIVANNFTFTQIDAPQLGLATLIETNDPRMLNAVFRDSRIWCTHSAGLPAGATATRTSVFWYELNPAAMPTPIVQSGALDGGADVHYYFPAISANSANDACVGFSRSDATMYVQAVYTGRLSTDALGTMYGIQTIKAGESSYTKFFSGSRNRWGDYSNTCVDPSDDLTFWTVQEYAGTNVGGGVNDGRWGTRWAKIVPPADLPIQLSYLRAVTSQQNSVRVEWGTITETNNFGFYIQKRRDGESEWSELPASFIAGQGTTLEPHHYAYVDEDVASGPWYYRLRQVDLDGTVHHTEGVRVDVLTGVGATSVPVEFALHQNFPNPFNPSTEIKYQISEVSRVTLKVYDVLGREVRTLVNEVQDAGFKTVRFSAEGGSASGGDAERLASGVYVYRLEAGNFVDVKRMVVLK